MARFIVDVANVENIEQVKQICEGICEKLNKAKYSSGIISATCIDGTNENQFYEVGDTKTIGTIFEDNVEEVEITWEYNSLTKEQIDNFNLHAQNKQYELNFH